ncbi:MAG: GntR family transcriptional regulator [Candidatus Latescibacteria bacterium]|nr:GntR family transcriptional regulator [Candidatus Latescibacterota bacterium]
MKDIDFELDQSSFSDRVYNAILELLINHRIKPGEKLSEEGLASLLQVSRTPVREALKRLASDGLVVFYPRRGAYAKGISPQDITELYELRRCLEVFAARRAVGNIPEKQIKRINLMIESCHLADGGDFIEAELLFDREIHKTINTYCNNTRLKEMLVNVDHLAKFMRILHFDREELARENFAEHENIWRAMIARDETLMIRLLEEHLDNRKKCLLDHFHMMYSGEEAVHS